MGNVWNDYASKYTGVLDEGITQDSKTGIFVDPEFKAKFVGTKNVIIPSLEMTGLGDYVRVGNGNLNEGYPGGRSVITYDTYTMEMERARKLPFDAMDADESGINNLIAQVTGSYKTKHIVPEVDAYNLSKFAKLSKDKGNQTTISTASANDKQSALAKFEEALLNAEESVAFSGQEMIAYVDTVMWGALMNNDKFAKQISVTNNNGSINTKVKEYNGTKIIVVDRNRMKTEFEFNPGTSDDEGGFKPKETAKSIRTLILPKDSAKFVKKLDELKVFTPKENQDGNAWIVDFHIYYDLFVMKSRENTIFSLVE